MTKAGSKKFPCKDIREVFDWRLSIGNAILFNSGEFWAVKILANESPDGVSTVLDEFITDIPTAKPTGPDGRMVQDPWEKEGMGACYDWIYSIRDKFSRDQIELRKPVVAMINAANIKSTRINADASVALANDSMDKYYLLRGQLEAHISNANREIKNATAKMNKEMAH